MEQTKAYSQIARLLDFSRFKGKPTRSTRHLFSQRDAHIHCKYGHQDACIHVNMGIGMPIFA